MRYDELHLPNNRCLDLGRRLAGQRFLDCTLKGFKLEGLMPRVSIKYHAVSKGHFAGTLILVKFTTYYRGRRLR